MICFSSSFFDKNDSLIWFFDSSADWINVTFEAISKKIKDAESQTENLSDAFRRFGKTASKTAFNDAISSSDKLKKHLTDLQKQGIIKTSKEYDELIKNIDDFQKGLKQGVKPTEDQKKAFKGILDTLNKLYPALEKTHQEMVDNFIKAFIDYIPVICNKKIFCNFYKKY